MANSPSPTVLPVVALGLALLLAAGAGPAAAQNCGCQPNFCCSKFGFCGQTTEYCGDGCRSGPCIRGGGGASVADVVTDAFFNGIKNQAGGGCEGKSFYTRGAFLTAVNSYSDFARGGSEVEDKREIAAFFAHVTHETGRKLVESNLNSLPTVTADSNMLIVLNVPTDFCFISEINKNDAYCDRDPRYSQWPCAEGKKYYGRGPLQLSWNYNYGAAGRDNNFDGLGNPDVVAQDPVIAFKAALWFWMNNVHRVMPQGFGATTRAINGNLECDGKNTDRMNARVGYYRQYCQQLGVDPGGNLTC
jgi:chitinase